MNRILLKFCFLLLIFITNKAFPQFPQYFIYDDENGLPSNEVYSIVQDTKGFIWIGCDGGLFKFDGIRYSHYKSNTQNSKSITGLTFSSSGRLYCYNFQSQIFYLDSAATSKMPTENDNSLQFTLQELNHKYSKISSIESDSSGNVYINHSNGLAVYTEKSAQWTDLPSYEIPADHYTSSSFYIEETDELRFLSPSGIGVRTKVGGKLIAHQALTPVGNSLLAYMENQGFIFSKYDNRIFKESNDTIWAVTNSSLNKILFNRKVTNVKALRDGRLWICTYKGIVSYDQRTDQAMLYYPDLSFSDAIIDREGNYWFSTLQAGLLRIYNLNNTVWNENHKSLEDDKFLKLATDGNHVFFASVNGTIGRIKTSTNELRTFHTGNNADIQSFDFDPIDKQLYFNINRHLYALSDNTIEEKPNPISTLKSYKKVGSDYFIASSFGTYIKYQGVSTLEKIETSWSRQIIIGENSEIVWIATNNGILKYYLKDTRWALSDSFLTTTQILSIDFDKHSGLLYALTFDGKIYSVSDKGELVLLTSIADQAQVVKIAHFNSKIYIATNKGIFIYDLISQAFQRINRLSGLASDNVRDLLILDEKIWLATSKGLQQIPLTVDNKKPLAKIYLNQPQKDIQLEAGYGLVLQPETSIYNANGNFEYAYSVNNNTWTRLPSSIERLEIQNIPSGNFNVALKAIDHLGRDSENMILISGFVSPPYWRTWWFVSLSIILLIIMIWLLIKTIIDNIKRREHEEKELLNSQLKAIRAQMNPHFMYNTLNSIQDLIIQQDIKSTNYYLSKFSQLMRQILMFSEEEKILLSEETEMLRNYLELEKLRFGDQFTYSFHIDEKIDATRTYIPSLIIQPYVENAMKHGLFHKKGQKWLSIDFKYQTQSLKIIIQDNGVGRKRSAEIKARNSLGHKSFASEAVQKRVDLLNKSGKFTISVKTDDIDKGEENTGTRIEIGIFSYNK